MSTLPYSRECSDISLPVARVESDYTAKVTLSNHVVTPMGPVTISHDSTLEQFDAQTLISYRCPVYYLPLACVVSTPDTLIGIRRVVCEHLSAGTWLARMAVYC